ncbi:MAG: NAD(P)/FAD-dependent oxidoreductase, partial [Ignavibacteriaceae bacterium]
MKRVIIIGCGFGGMSAAKVLAKYDYEITIIDKTNHHLFQPLLYQVATAALSPGDIANPIRSSFRNDKNVNVILGEVTSIDRKNKEVHLNQDIFKYDYLIVAIGSRHHYFGKSEWEKFAPGLKTLNDALKIWERILLSLETADKTTDPAERERELTYVIVGGGPTGVELAGAIGEIVNRDLIKDFRNINAGMTRVYLVETVSRILSSYPESLSLKAKKNLEDLGVKVLLNTRVNDVNDEGVLVGEKFIRTKNIIWAAGNKGLPLLETLNVELTKAGTIAVNPDLTINNDPDVFVIGDSAVVKDKKESMLPAIAPVAMQQGRYVAKIIGKNVPPEKRKKFVYIDKGTLATIGKAKAVAVIKGFKLSGFLAWAA